MIFFDDDEDVETSLKRKTSVDDEAYSDALAYFLFPVKKRNAPTAYNS